MFKRRKLLDAQLIRHKRETVFRSNILTHPLIGRLSLRNQLGATSLSLPLTSHSNEDVAAYYAASLLENPKYASEKPISGLGVDDKNGNIVFAQSNSGGNGDTLHCIPSDQTGTYFGSPPAVQAMPSSFVHMSINIQSAILFYVSSGARGTKVTLTDIPDRKDPRTSFMDHVWDVGDETAWQTAASPEGMSFAVASTGGLTIYSMQPDQATYTMWVDYRTPDSCEYMAVAYGRNDRTAMAGRRSGAITFYDIRTNGSVTRLRHEDAVTAMRSIDDHRIVVRGLQKVHSSLHYSSFSFYPSQTLDGGSY
jgi:hypothetical protein